MTSALSLLKGKVEREGILQKAANAKGKDEFRAGWQERWFVLKGKTLSYYKKGDSEPKGQIDLDAAKIDSADESTGTQFTIRIAQAKQVFSYVQAANPEDKEAWLMALRKCAGYRVEKTSPVAAVSLKSQTAAFCCAGAFFKASATNRNVDHTVLVLDTDDRSLKIFQDGKLVKTHATASIAHIECAQQPDARTPWSGEQKLYTLHVDFKADNYLTRKSFIFATLREAGDFRKLLQHTSQSDWQAVQLIHSISPVQFGSVQLRLPFVDPSSDALSPRSKPAAPSRDSPISDKWEDLWVVVIEWRVIVFPSRDATVPLRVISLPDSSFSGDGKVAIIVQSPLGTYMMRFVDEATRDGWLRAIKTASVSLKEQIDREFKSNDAGGGARSAVSPRSPRGAGSTMSLEAPSFVVSWGLGEQGQLGHRIKDSVMLPSVVEALRSKKVRSIAAGDTYVAAVTAEGHVYVWGEGEQLQLGLGDSRRQSSSPYLITSLRSSPVCKVACGQTHVLALTESGEVLAWGSNSNGQLGLGSQVPCAAYPVPVTDLAGKRAANVFAGGFQSAALIPGAGLFVWGAGANGRLGTGKVQDVFSPLLAPINSKGVVVTAAFGTDFHGIVLQSGALFMCGSNVFGKLGLGDCDDRLTPCEVLAFTQAGLKVRQIALGGKHSLALVEGGDGCPYTWGAAVHNGHTQECHLPAPIKALAGTAQASASATHTLLISSKRKLFAFGTNSHAELGNGQAHVQGLVQVTLNMGDDGMLQVAAGNSFSVGLASGDPPSTFATTNSIERISELPRMPVRPVLDSGSPVISEAVVAEQINNLLSSMQLGPPSDAPPPDMADDPTRKKKKPLWKEVMDPKSGRSYFYHAKTRETRWKKPEDEDVEELNPSA